MLATPITMNDSTPKPWEFPLDSAESRAAARSVIEQRDRVDLRIVVDILQVANSNAPLKRRSYRCLNDGKVVEVVIFEPESSSERGGRNGMMAL